MNSQEQKIVTLVLNEMAFEGAMKHFGEAPPELSKELCPSSYKVGHQIGLSDGGSGSFV